MGTIWGQIWVLCHESQSAPFWPEVTQAEAARAHYIGPRDSQSIRFETEDPTRRLMEKAGYR